MISLYEDNNERDVDIEANETLNMRSLIRTEANNERP